MRWHLLPCLTKDSNLRLLVYVLRDEELDPGGQPGQGVLEVLQRLSG